jgi:hypothetical protein
VQPYLIGHSGKAKPDTSLPLSGARPRSSTDLMIAAHARSLDATVVTDNRKDFGRVRGLKSEDWLDGTPAGLSRSLALAKRVEGRRVPPLAAP